MKYILWVMCVSICMIYKQVFVALLIANAIYCLYAFVKGFLEGYNGEEISE